MKTSTTLFVSALALTGCTLGMTDVSLGNHPTSTQLDPNNTLPTTPNGNPDNTPPPRCDLGRTYTGFGGAMLEAGRVDFDLGLERAQVKPYSALLGDYARVLKGSTPALLTSSATAFGLDADRWLKPPISSAITVFTAYRVAFQGCLTATASAAKYQTAPTGSTADTECRSWARTFWSRDATDDEAAACVQVATVDTLKEGTNTNVAPARRWAYTCAAVLSAAGFMTY
jgi:hypothetical protein